MILSAGLGLMLAQWKIDYDYDKYMDQMNKILVLDNRLSTMSWNSQVPILDSNAVKEIFQ